MPRYRIHYLKESQREHFRHSAPSPAPLLLKSKDYRPGGEIEASTPYAVWKKMRAEGPDQPIDLGDALESETGALLVCRYVGFEEAQWFVPEAAPTGQPGDAAPAGPSTMPPGVATPGATPSSGAF